MALREVSIHIDRSQLRALERAYTQLPRQAQRSADKASLKLAKNLARMAAAAARAEGRQGKLAARTVTAVPGTPPRITAGAKGSAKAQAVTAGSEFGANQQFGWYANARYDWAAGGHQFKPHRGSASYWFFRTVEESGPLIGQAYAAALDEIASGWGGAR